MDRHEFKSLLVRFGDTCDYVGWLRADPECRATMLPEAEAERERLWSEILEALDELVKEES